MNEDIYKAIMKEAPFGYALHEEITDQTGKARDYRIIEVNEAFEIFSGIQSDNLTGKTTQEVITENKTEFNLANFYSNIIQSIEKKPLNIIVKS